jgi:uncharacterized membrane protein
MPLNSKIGKMSVFDSFYFIIIGTDTYDSEITSELINCLMMYRIYLEIFTFINFPEK